MQKLLGHTIQTQGNTENCIYTQDIDPKQIWKQLNDENTNLLKKRKHDITQENNKNKN